MLFNVAKDIDLVAYISVDLFRDPVIDDVSYITQENEDVFVETMLLIRQLLAIARADCFHAAFIYEFVIDHWEENYRRMKYYHYILRVLESGNRPTPNNVRDFERDVNDVGLRRLPNKLGIVVLKNFEPRDKYDVVHRHIIVNRQLPASIDLSPDEFRPPIAKWLNFMELWHMITPVPNLQPHMSYLFEIQNIRWMNHEDKSESIKLFVRHKYVKNLPDDYPNVVTLRKRCGKMAFALREHTEQRIVELQVQIEVENERADYITSLHQRRNDLLNRIHPNRREELRAEGVKRIRRRFNDELVAAAKLSPKRQTEIEQYLEEEVQRYMQSTIARCQREIDSIATRLEKLYSPAKLETECHRLHQFVTKTVHNEYFGSEKPTVNALSKAFYDRATSRIQTLRVRLENLLGLSGTMAGYAIGEPDWTFIPDHLLSPEGRFMSLDPACHKHLSKNVPWWVEHYVKRRHQLYPQQLYQPSMNTLWSMTNESLISSALDHYQYFNTSKPITNKRLVPLLIPPLKQLTNNSFTASQIVADYIFNNYTMFSDRLHEISSPYVLMNLYERGVLTRNTPGCGELASFLDQFYNQRIDTYTIAEYVKNSSSDNLKKFIRHLMIPNITTTLPKTQWTSLFAAVLGRWVPDRREGMSEGDKLVLSKDIYVPFYGSEMFKEDNLSEFIPAFEYIGPVEYRYGGHKLSLLTIGIGFGCIKIPNWLILNGTCSLNQADGDLWIAAGTHHSYYLKQLINGPVKSKKFIAEVGAWTSNYNLLSWAIDQLHGQTITKDISIPHPIPESWLELLFEEGWIVTSTVPQITDWLKVKHRQITDTMLVGDIPDVKPVTSR